MKLRNYTSSVPVERSLQLIEKLLVEAGCTAISRFYDDQKVAGFIFQIPVNGMPLTFKLPSNPLAVRRIMEKEVKYKTRDVYKRIGEQAERTSWKLLYEWVHIQITMIRMDQAEALQVFLPYAFDGKNNQTFFEKLKEGGFKQLEMPKNE